MGAKDQDCQSKCHAEVSHTGTGDRTRWGGDEEATSRVRKRGRGGRRGLPVTAAEAKLTLTSGGGNLAERVEKLHGLPDEN